MNRLTRRPFLTTMIVLWPILLGCIFAVPNGLTLERRGDFLIRNTVRLALLYWAFAIVQMIRNIFSARLIWTLACAAFLIHVAMAFEHAHHWSHAEAFQHVREAGGFGEGIFVSYLFTLVWTADVVWWWIARQSHGSRPRWISWSLHGFMIFVIVNATVIFENGATRWISGAALGALAYLFLRVKPRAAQ